MRLHGSHIPWEVFVGEVLVFMLIPLLANIARGVIGEHFNATDEYRHFAHVPVFVIMSACSTFPPPLSNQRFCFEQVDQIIPKARYVVHFF